MMDALWGALASGLLAGVVSAIATTAAVRVEIRWLRRTVENHERRIINLERTARQP